MGRTLGINQPYSLLRPYKKKHLCFQLPYIIIYTLLLGYTKRNLFSGNLIYYL